MAELGGGGAGRLPRGQRNSPTIALGSFPMWGQTVLKSASGNSWTGLEVILIGSLPPTCRDQKIMSPA